MDLMIPIEFTILFSVMSLSILILILVLEFIEPNFNKSIFAIILSFINIPISYIACMSYFVFDLYGYTTSGTLVSNPVVDMFPIGIIFLLFAYLNILLFLYGLYLLYKKPWKELMKIHNMDEGYWYESEYDL